MEIAAEVQWRADFRRRIDSALAFLRGQRAFGKTQARHFNDFNNAYLNNQSFRQEVEKLSPFEIEVFCVSSTLSQLKADSEYFTASEVTQALAFNIQDHRRGEIRDKILSKGNDDLPDLYRGARERAILSGQDDRINDIQRWIKASLNDHAIQSLLEALSHEHAIVSSPHQANGVITLATQTTDSQAEPLPPTPPTGAARIAPSLPNNPPSNDKSLLSISLRWNGIQADLCRQPDLGDEALVLAHRFQDHVQTVQDLRQALKTPRSRKSIMAFLCFVFGYSSGLDQLALDRKLKLREMNPISLLLCSATYTKTVILNLSEGRFQSVLSSCCEFLGDPRNVAASLPVEVGHTVFSAKTGPDDHETYSVFLRGLCEYQRALEAIPPSLPARISTRAEKPSRLSTPMTWPQQHVAAILRFDTSSLVLLSQLARLYKETGRDIPCPDDVTEALVIASKSAPLNVRMQILDMAAELLTDSAPAAARGTIVHQRSVALRLLGNSHHAEHEILSFLEHTPDVPELLLKSLQLSLAETRVYQFRHQEAHEIARSIQVGADSEDKFQLLWDHIYCAGRIMRGQGDFESASVCFEQCCQITHGIRPSKVILSRCALADIYCELDYRSGDPQHPYLLQAESILKPTVESVGETNPKSRRRLLLSLSEVYIRQSQIPKATATLKGLLPLFGALECPDIIDRLGHVRLHMALARSCPSGESMPYWREALRLNKAYNPTEEEVFTCAVIYLNLSWLSYCEGQSDQGQKTFAQASEVLRRKGREYLIPGIGTYVYDEVNCNLG